MDWRESNFIGKIVFVHRVKISRKANKKKNAKGAKIGKTLCGLCDPNFAVFA